MDLTDANDNVVHGPIHDEVYMALKPLTNIMRIHGLFPIPTHVKPDHFKSEVDNLKFRWGSKLLLFSVVAYCGIGCCYYFVLWDYAYSMYDTNPLEAIVISFNTSLVTSEAVINVSKMVAQAPKWRSYFVQWQNVDGMLGITTDRMLRFYVKFVSAAYAVYASTALGTMVYVVIMKYVDPSVEDSTGDGFAIALICYSIYFNGCQLLPEILFTCFSFAINLRFSRLTCKMDRMVRNESSSRRVNQKSEIAKELEESRIAFESLMSIIKSTNAIMGPTLLLCVIVTSSYMSTIVFMFFYQSMDNPGLAYAKATYSSVCLLRLMSICFLADGIKRKLKQFKRTLYLIPAAHLSQESVEELSLFIMCTKKTQVSITAWDFITIDKELLNKVASAILTYTITIIEFYEKQEKVEEHMHTAIDTAASF